MIIVVILVGFTLNVSAEEGTGKAYTYDHKSTAVAVPDPYTTETVLYGKTNGFNLPADVVTHNGLVYILNTESSVAVSVFDENFEKVRDITLSSGEKAYTLSTPKGMWVDNDGSLLFAEYGKKRVIRTDKDGKITAEYLGPDNEASQNTEFLPYKVLTDYLGNIYVLSEGEYRGIVRLSPSGEFMSYFGSKSIKATASVLLDMAWRRFMSREQIANSARYLPTEYSNMTIDPMGFVYATSGSASDEKEMVVKLNSNGSNVLEGSSYGDFNLGKFGSTYYKTSLNAIAVDEEGFITVADKTWNRLMQYSSEGDLLYVFGGKGTAEGTFSENSRIAALGNKLLIADTANNSITVMVPTKFGSNVRSGFLLFEKGLFEESIAPWNEVLAEAGNYEAAYVGIGKALQLKKDYKGAMEYFKKGYSRTDYSASYQRYRSEVMRAVFPIVMTVVVIIALVAFAIYKVYRKKHPKQKKEPLDKRGKIAYMFYCLIHPFDGFSEMRYNQKGSMMIANIIMVLWFLMESVKFNYKGFIFNTNEPADFSVFALVVTTVGMAAMFCLSNWLFSTFFEGKGSLRAIWINFAYGLVPMLAVSVLEVILSNLLTKDESFFIEYLGIFGMLYAVFLIFVGNGELHQYSFKKNILSILASCVGVLIIMFIVFLLFNLFVQLKDFVQSVFEEAFYRISVGF